MTNEQVAALLDSYADLFRMATVACEKQFPEGMPINDSNEYQCTENIWTAIESIERQVDRLAHSC